MQVSVSSVRAGDLLKRQLERLQDVMWVELRPPAMKLAGRPETIKT